MSTAQTTPKTAATRKKPTRRTNRPTATKTPVNLTRQRWLITLVAVGLVVLVGVILAVELVPQTHTYRESVGTINNPGVGYTTIWSPTFYPQDYYDRSKHNPTLPTWVQGTVTLMINLAPFSAGQNAIGVDYPLDDQFCADLRQIFAALRANGSTIAVRFRYDHDGNADPEPNSFAQVLDHIQTLKASHIFADYADIVMYVESGFVGKWGEQHGGKYTTLDYKVQLLTALLDAIPAPIPVTVRTPDIFAAWAGITRAELGTVAVTKPGHERIGLYNDGYLGSASDLGTYVNRAQETAWLGQQTQAYFGGEFSGNWAYAQQFDTYLPTNALPEMYQTHLAYINGNIYPYYQNVTFDATLAIPGVDNRAYYGQSVFQFIRDHLGYRFVLQQSQTSTHVKPGHRLRGNFTVTNNGFANLSHLTTTQIVLTQGDKTCVLPVKLAVNTWQTTTTQKVAWAVTLPAKLASGTWQIELRVTVGNYDAQNPAARTVAFANENTYNAAMGTNYLGTVRVN